MPKVLKNPTNNKLKSKMFEFIDRTWNPLAGECKTVGICQSYCWAKDIAKRYNLRKYLGDHRLCDALLKKKFGAENFVFVCSMNDLFDPTVPSWMINKILDAIRVSPATFLLLTKNPCRYKNFDVPSNCVCGATVETDVLGDCSERLVSMRDLKHKRKMVSVEPIMKFSPNFLSKLVACKLEFVAVGYDNYFNKLDEPSKEITEILIVGLRAWGVKVYEKAIREKWNK